MIIKIYLPIIKRNVNITTLNMDKISYYLKNPSKPNPTHNSTI